MPQQWVHSFVLYRNRVVEVLRLMSSRRGLKPIPLGWYARIEIGDVEVRTTKIYATQESAEQAVCDACDKLFAQE